MLSIYADVYSMLTSSRCRTCVKMIDVSKDDPEDIAIFTLARDQLSSAENREHDKRRAVNRLDALRDNSDFVQLWVPSSYKDHYFC